MKKTLNGYNGCIIYQVFIQLQDKIIWVKDFRIFEDTSKKNSISLPNFESKSLFEDFLTLNQKENLSNRDININIVLKQALGLLTKTL